MWAAGNSLARYQIKGSYHVIIVGWSQEEVVFHADDSELI